jgi:hypothetical protein
MMLREIAHVRTGDKGDTSQIAVIAHDVAHYQRLARNVTCDSLRAHLQVAESVVITRYELPDLGALNFVLEGMLRGGVTRSLALDPHGKTIGAQLLDLVVSE